MGHADYGSRLHEFRLGFESHLASRAPDAPLTVDGIAAAIRDDSRFALVRSDVLLTVESGDTFRQLTDAAGACVPAPNETLQAGIIDGRVQEGGV